MNTHAKAVQSSYIYTRESPDKAKQYVAANLPGYHIHEGLSDNHSVVLHDPKSNDVIIAYRGTLNPLQHPVQGMQDYIADAQIALGLNHVYTIPRQQEADLKYQRTASMFPHANIKVAGHSLGAVESYHVATKNNLEGHHFSMGESPLPGIATLNRTQALFHTGEQYNKQHIYHTDNYKALGNVYSGSDPISESTRYLAGQHHFIKANTGTNLNAHNLSNFISKSNKPTSLITSKPHIETSSRPPLQSVDVEMKKKRKKYKHIV
jgi:hypothetical protein